MYSVKIFDAPTRVFHWFFATGFAIAFAIAKQGDDESIWYALHMGIGLVLAFMVVLRIVWFFFGSQYARLSSFELNPASLFSYFKGFFSKHQIPRATHNPASSWAALVMLLSALGLAVTGFLMTSTPNKEDFEDFHEILAHVFLASALAHVLGVLAHQIKHRDHIWKSMISGSKNLQTLSDPPIFATHARTGILFVALVLGFSTYLFKNFEASKGTLNFFGTQLQLSRGSDDEGDEGSDNGKEGEEENADDSH